VGLVSEDGEPLDEPPADIDIAEMEAMRASARAADEEISRSRKQRNGGNVFDAK
jgi:hypothetical protein